MGGHVRVGFENNLLLPDGSLAKSNAAMIAECGDVLHRLGRATAAADALRTDWHRMLQ
jgi:uncharacterized protein (DUF849 family)